MGLFQEATALFFTELWRLVPAFVIGVGVAAFIKTFQWDLKLRAYMRDSGRATIPLAVFLGVFSPLCACGVLPVVIPLAVAGVPLPPLLALLATSPLMSPDAFSITWAGLGPAFAWIKLATAVGMGLMVGTVTNIIQKRSNFARDIIKIKPVHNPDGSVAGALEIACANDLTIPSMSIRPRDSRAMFFWDRARDVGTFMGKLLLLATALQVAMEMFLPMDLVRVLAGRSDMASLVTAALLGIPLPAHQVAIVPVIKGLLDMGMDPGAAVTFLVAGPVTSVPALVVLWRIFRPRLFWLYLGLCLGGAVISGVLYRVLAQVLLGG